MKTHLVSLSGLAAAMALGAATAGQAAVTTFSGFDLGAANVGPNSIAAATAFNAAVGASSLIDFESLAGGSDTNGASPAPGVTLTSVGWNIQASTTCGGPLCGDNTTPAGAKFAYSNSSLATLTFTFTTPISAFGAFFGGLQTDTSTLQFDDGSAHSIFLPVDASLGGFAFVGFNDPGASITSVTVDVPFDLISVDDVSYAHGVGGVKSGAPEPAAWAMMLTGFAGLGAMARRRRRAAAA
jgi:hypothetical protein